MSKKAPKKPKFPTQKDTAAIVATAHRRKADAEKGLEKAMEELANAIAEDFDAGAAVFQAESAFEQLALEEARKRFGLPMFEDEYHQLAAPLRLPCPCVGRAGCDCDYTVAKPEFTFSVAKPLGGTPTITPAK